MTQYIIHHEKGVMAVLANSEKEAEEQYYESLEGMIGHYLKICGCFGPKSPIDRTKVSQIISIERRGKVYG